MLYIYLLLLKLFVLVIITLLVTKSLTENTKILKMAEDDFTDKDYDANAPDLPAVPPKVPEAHLEKVFTLSIETIFTIKSNW